MNHQTSPVKIDFVLPWVDGSDQEWLALKRKYETSDANILCSDPDANGENRYRDYGLLRYWFRGVERFAPWVNRIFFVTCGQKPDWLDESNPKLRLVNHTDYIPTEYLPTFHSNTIELNLHRINDLSEHFVLFNDDTFLLRPVKPEFFFKKGMPVLSCDIGIPRWIGCNCIGRTVINNCGILKKNMNVEQLLWKNIWKYIDIRALGLARASKNLLSIIVNRTMIPGTFGHFPQPHLKSTMDELWNKAPNVMDKTCRHRFRSDDCVNQWLACAWNMTSGRFYPANEKKRGLFIQINRDNLPRISDVIHRQSIPQICLSDGRCDNELDSSLDEISRGFEKMLYEKSSFEK